jgi:hypothetical protein
MAVFFPLEYPMPYGPASLGKDPRPTCTEGRMRWLFPFHAIRREVVDCLQGSFKSKFFTKDFFFYFCLKINVFLQWTAAVAPPEFPRRSE